MENILRARVQGERPYPDAKRTIRATQPSSGASIDRHDFLVGTDLAVDFVGEATLTFPMADAAGREWSSAEIRARTELVLARRFARIATVEEALLGRPEEVAA